MRSALLTLLLVATAVAAREHVTSRFIMPPGGERFLRVMKAAVGCKDYDCKNRIVGGGESTPHSRAYQAGLFLIFPFGRAFCSGSLISSEWVLTAAHCIFDGEVPVPEFEIVLGAHNIWDVAGTTRFTSRTAIYHPQWSPETLQNDIGLVRIPAQVSPSDRIQFVNLPPRSASDQTFNGFLGTVSGWGKTADDDEEDLSDNLHQVDAEVITNFLCNVQYLGLIEASHICTSGSGGKGSCAGDSGGPLTVNLDGSVILVGSVSFGLRFSCEIGWPSVYTRITSYLDWISSNTGIAIN